MTEKLIHVVSIIHFMCKIIGITSYSIKKIDTKKIFVRTKIGIVLNFFIGVTFVLMSNVTDCHNEEDDVEFTSSSIATWISYFHLIVIIGTMNLKQNQIIDIFYKLIRFHKLVDRITKRPVNVAKLSTGLKWYIGVQYLQMLIMLGIHMSGTQLSWLCYGKLMIRHIVRIHVETLFVCFLIISKYILHGFNRSLEKDEDFGERPGLVVDDVKGVFQICYELKKHIQNVFQINLFIKFVYIILEFATTLYSVVAPIIDDWIVFIPVHWLITLLLNSILLIYPVTSFCKEVRDIIKFGKI
jgi:hypothetical protein